MKKTMTFNQLKKLIKESMDDPKGEVALGEFTTKLGEAICTAVQSIYENREEAGEPVFGHSDINNFLHKLIAAVMYYDPEADEEALHKAAQEVVFSMYGE